MTAETTLFELAYTFRDDEEEAVEFGAVFTKRWIVDHILDLAGYTADRDLARMRATEPACGRGAFLVPMVDRLVTSCRTWQRPLSEIGGAIQAFDLVHDNVVAARAAVREILIRHFIDANEADRLVDAWVIHDDYLLSPLRKDDVDFVIGNPPYVRLEAVPAARQVMYRRELHTMGGRADIFVGFFERGLRSLRGDGTLAFICADRWMRNSYGQQLRELVAEDYNMKFVLSAHDVDAFDEPVSAYPAITLISRGGSPGTIIADTTSAFGPSDAAVLQQWTMSADSEELKIAAVNAARLPKWFGGERSWPTGTPSRLSVLADLERRFAPLEDPRTRTKIGIGVATGADSVYLCKPAPNIEKSRQLPLAMASDIRSGHLHWSGHYLANPWDERGLVDIRDYPELEAYFVKNSAQLRGRSVAKRQPYWYRTIDRVNMSLTERPKLLLADMATHICPVFDSGGHYPHHNLYWITSDVWDLKVLGGLLLSDVAELFVSSYCVRMRGGTLRFQAQYLRRIRVPEYDSISVTMREELSVAFEERDASRASTAAAELYGVDLP